MGYEMDVGALTQPVYAADRYTASTGATTKSAAPAASVGSSGSSLPNPKIELDPSLNLLVLQFRISGGDIVNSIPSLQQLNAYESSNESSSSSKPAAAEA